MVWVDIILVLALLEYIILGFNVSRNRVKYDVKAPATAGNPIFERHYRVHQNTLEQLIVFVPALLLFAFFVSRRWAAILGALFVIARIVYAAGYVRDPEQRSYGAAMTAVVNIILVIGSLIGLLRAA